MAAANGSGSGKAEDPLRFDVGSILSDGHPTHVTRTGPVGSRIGLPMIGIEPGTEVTLDAQLVPLGDGLMVDATVTAPLHGQCSRCLDDLNSNCEFRINEVFAATEDFIGGEEAEDGDEVPSLDRDQLDLTQTLIDAAGLSLPFNPTCEDYDLPCNNEVTPDEPEDLIDPRWAGLEKFQ